MTTTDYNKQAKDLLNKLGIEFKIEFLKHDFHFAGDKEKRDIYNALLVRGNRSMKVVFGQSIKDSGFYIMTGKKRTDIDRKYLDKEYLRKFKTSVVMVAKRLVYDFNPQAKSDFIHYPVTPDEYSILACLQKYDVGTFEDFCSEFGYDTDSRQAEKVYNAVKEEYLNVCTIFNDKELEELQEIN